MEDNIEYWHTFKLEKYMSALMNVKDWTFHYLVLEVGCRGWIPPRFFSLMRQLGFSSREVRGMHDNAQLIARKCSYVIWLNRYNKDFHPIRISISDGPVLAPDMSTQLNDPVTSPQLNDSVTSTDVVGKSAAVHFKLSGKDKERADRNRLLAISRRNAKSSSISNIVSASDSVHSKLSGKDKERTDRNRLLAISRRNTTSSSTSTKLSVEEKVIVDRNRRLALHRLRAKNSKHAVGVISKPFTLSTVDSVDSGSNVNSKLSDLSTGDPVDIKVSSSSPEKGVSFQTLTLRLKSVLDRRDDILTQVINDRDRVFDRLEREMMSDLELLRSPSSDIQPDILPPSSPAKESGGGVPGDNGFSPLLSLPLVRLLVL